MEKGMSKVINSIWRMIGKEKQKDVECFCLEKGTNTYKEFSDPIEVYSLIDSIDNDFVKNYSGFNYKHINNALRNKWNYEEDGNEVQKERFVKMGQEIANFISNQKTAIGNVLAFRGVSIEYFKDYGIEKIEELENLKQKYIFDFGFVSTSLVLSQSFFHKKNNLGLNYNILIEYLISDEFDDGVLIGSNSYNNNECEYLINKANMGFVTDVNINKEDAIVKVLLIPKKIYDEYYKNERVK